MCGGVPMSVKWPAVWLTALSLMTLTAPGCSGRPPADTGCSAGRGQYDAQDVALRLDPGWDAEGSYLLPLGKVVVTWPGVCANGLALQAVGTQLAPSTPYVSDRNAFRAVRVGTVYLNHPYACGEACQKPVNVRITVTDGCQRLSRDAAAKMATPQYPLPPPVTVSTKLIRASQYEQLFGGRLNLAADSLVWAVLAATESAIQSSPPTNPPALYWSSIAVGACTDRASPWSGGGSSPPAGWDAVADQAAPGA